jgi:hypothetical protein
VRKKLTRCAPIANGNDRLVRRIQKHLLSRAGKRRHSCRYYLPITHPRGHPLAANAIVRQ